ncbi:MAG: hypothetical protein KBS70_07020 [Bacteroidales bacterium]|nr:hypothetical protein [Candidatus Colicola equi]
MAIRVIVRDSECNVIDFTDKTTVADYKIRVFSAQDPDTMIERTTGQAPQCRVLIDSSELDPLPGGQVMVSVWLRFVASEMPDGKFDSYNIIPTDIYLDEKEVTE